MSSLNSGVPTDPPMGQVMTNRGAAVAVGGAGGVLPSLNSGGPTAPPMGQVMTNRGAAVAVAGTAGWATGAGVVVEGATAWLAVVCVAWGARVLPNAAIARPAPRTATAT